MHRFRIGEAAQLLGVSVDTVRRWADQGRLKTQRTPGGQREIAGPELARLALELAEAPHDETRSVSARNRFPGLVTRVVRDTVMAQVEIQAGPHRVVSLISAEAADDLGLEPGVRAVASIKSTAVVIERA
ncbi:MAG: TOBE domain-containing protein [Acidimicrobiaceae bacterium]|nr:helix-turn-helix transcriptional regulator [Acidimicrobiia bacterium]MCY4495276.1 TOBE domain-containing protein [Acidimicrobiaceae bacterium]